MEEHKPKAQIYKRDQIQKVYHRHHYNCGTVVYSTNGGWSWKSVPMDSGKWFEEIDGDTGEWVFAFIEIPGVS